MSLITNEIHMFDGFKRTLLVFAADRRLTKLDGTYGGTRRKLFPIPYLEAGISYFGLATVFPRGRACLLSDWLAGFINQQAGAGSLEEFAARLRNALHEVTPERTLAQNASGFHICGYDSRGLPDFWYLSNIGGMDEFRYTQLYPRYDEPRSHFLGRDALKLGWDGISVSSVRNEGWVYRNGDYRAHAFAWQRLDEFMGDMRRFSDFRGIHTSREYEQWVKFKFEVIAYFYKKFANQKIIGTPIDVLSLSKALP